MSELSPRAQRRAEKSARKAARPWPARHWLLTALGAIVLIVIIASVASSGGGKTPPAQAGNSASPSNETSGKILQHAADVKITSCAPDSAGFADAKVTVTNHSSKASDYVITIAFESPDGKTQYGTGDVLVNSLQPGQSTVQDADALQAASGPFVCKIASAQRTQSSL